MQMLKIIEITTTNKVDRRVLRPRSRSSVMPGGGGGGGGGEGVLRVPSENLLQAVRCLRI